MDCKWLASVVALVGLAPLYGQTGVSLGEIYGQVVDPSGAGANGVMVVATNKNTGLRRVAETGSTGQYRLLLLPPGEYLLSATKAGFRPEQVDGVTVTVGAAILQELALQLAPREEKIDVEGSAELLQMERTNPAIVISESRIRNLPINRRDYLTFVLLAPGVADGRNVVDNTDLRVKQTPTSEISIYGSNGRGNLVTVDGGEMLDGSGGIRSNVSQEAVQEFQINRGNYGAEIGAASGGAINIVTRSGTNTRQASLFWFSRHQSLDAADPFARLVERGGTRRIEPPSARQQAGGSFGMPLRKDRTFLFAAVETLVRRESSVVTLLPDYSIFGPTPSQERFLASLPSAQAAPLRQLLTSPPSTVALFEANSGVHPFRTDSWKSNLRIDHLPSERNQFMLRLDVPRLDESNANLQALVGASRGLETFQFDPTAHLAWTHVFSHRLANEFRLQANYRKYQVSTREKFGPELRIAGYGVFNRDIFLPSRNLERRFEVKNNLHWASGRSVLRVGGQLLVRSILADSEVFFPGRFTFGDLPGALVNPALPPDFVLTGLQAFNLGLPQTFIMGSGSSAIGALYPYTGLYVQNSLRLAPRLNLDLGLRYEVDARGAQLPVDWNNVGPRVGFAWAPAASGKTVVRGGYGIFYGLGNFAIDYSVQALNEINGYRQIAQAFRSILETGPSSPVAIFTTLRNSGVISLPTPTRALQPSDLAPFGITFSQTGPRPPFSVLFQADPDYASPYTQQGNLAVETALGDRWTIELGGVWSKTLRLPRSRNINLLPAPIDPALGIPVWSSFSSFVDPLLASRNVFESTARSWYTAATVELRKRFQRNFDLGANYTFSRAIDEAVDYNYDFQAFDQTNQRAERALSSFHQKHKAVLWTTVALPGRWQASAIARGNSGRPFNLLAGYDLNQDRNDQTDRPAFAGRNTGIGPAFFTADVRLAHTFRLGEASQLEFTAEAFNLMNRLNLATVNNVVGNIAGPFRLTGRHDRLPTQPLGFTSAFDARKIQLGLRVRLGK